MTEIIDHILAFSRDGLAMGLTFGGIGTGAFVLGIKNIVSKVNKDDADVLSITLVSAKRLLVGAIDPAEKERLETIITNLEARIESAKPIIAKIKETITNNYE